MMRGRRPSEAAVHRRTTVAALVIAVVLLTFGAGSASAGGTIAIGDSVMRGAQPQLRARGFRVDATVSRQFSEGVTLVRRLRSSGDLPNRVVVHLGNNGYLTMEQCADLADIVGNRSLWLVNLRVPRVWRSGNNDRLERCASRYDHVRLIDWYGYSSGHGEWFRDDGYHLTAIGANRYAAYLDRFA